MCGIAGVRRFGEVPITPEEIAILLMSIEHRGNHATGIALVSDGQIHIHKAPVPAWRFCSDDATKEFLEAHLPNATTALLHTRYATIGNPEENENNHPMFAGRAAVVHNGGIQNHEQMFNEMQMERSCKTDSDVFRAAIDKEGLNANAIKLMNRFSGSAAIAAVTTDDPNLLLLARSGSPLVYGLSKPNADDKLWWASELHAIQKAVRPWEQTRGLFNRRYRNDVGYFTVPDHTAYILNREGLDRKFEFKVCSHYRQPVYNMRGTYWAQQQKWKKEMDGKKPGEVKALPGPNPSNMPHKMGECPGCGKRHWISVHRKWADFYCTDAKCNRSFMSLDSRKPEEFTYGDFSKPQQVGHA